MFSARTKQALSVAAVLLLLAIALLARHFLSESDATAHLALPAGSPNFSPPVNNSRGCPAVYCALAPVSRAERVCREPGGRGRIRTFVARKERQIYSLLVLATHPPVPVLVVQAF